MPVLKHKVFAYITHGRRLLVFRPPESPEAGIQVPAGTVQPGEDLAAAVLREAAEETGRTDLVLVRFLGEQVRDRRDVDRDVGRDEIHHRHFYHLRCTGDPPATWRHWETDPSDGSPGPIPFDFFWAPLPDGVPELIAGHGNLLPQLLAALEPDA
jgi:8-oxo-dGTP pyrophosphatase MutT (NUDIX family)